MTKAKDYSFVHDGAIYTFMTKPEKAEHASQLAGRPVYIDQEICMTRIPSMGAPKQENSATVTSDWLDYKDGFGRADNPGTLFRDHYDKWKAGMASAATGTPLEDHSDLTPAMMKTLEASGVTTLEALAAMDPAILSKVLGPRSREILATAKELTAPVDKNVAALRAENVQMASDMEALKAQIAELTAARAPKGKKAPAPAEEAPAE